MPYRSALEVLDILADHGIKEIDIMGGEPSLLEWMPDFTQRASLKGMAVNISTNGSRPELMRRLSESDPAKVTIGVSLEGSSAANHNRLTRSSHFGLALLAIRNLVSLGLDPVVKTVLNSSTREDIQDIVDLVRDLGVRRYYLIHMDVMAKAPSLMREALGYVDFLKFHDKVRRDNPGLRIFRVNASCFEKNNLPPAARCAGGVLKLSIMPDGSVYPCNLFQSCNEFGLGNIFDDDFSSVWGSPKLSYFRSQAENACGASDCENRATCTGGCPAHGYFHYRNADARDIRCATAGEEAFRH